MKSPSRIVWSAALASLLLSGAVHAGQRNQDRILAEIRQIQSQLQTLTETQNTLTAAVEQLLADREEQSAADRRSRAETGSALDRMERNVATLSEASSELNERLSALMAEVEAVREAQRRAALTGVTADEGEDTAMAEEAADDATDDSDDAVSDAEGQTGDATVLDEPSITEIYMEADADRLQGRYELAIAGFERVIEFGGELEDNARYGIGDALLAQDQLEAALEQFDILIRDFPDSNKLGDAWFQKGVILGRLGHETDSREIFEDILEIYAGTTAARAAQRQLDAMDPGDPGA